jgi:transcriptional regulator of arginine metabolism
VSRAQRRHYLAQLLRERPISTQAELAECLARKGFDVTQATVSRDLKELGAVKMRLAGGRVGYVLPEVRPAVSPEESLRRVLAEWVTEVASSGNVVVVKTLPGSAHVVGSAMDRAELPGVLGTVAGDDTLLVVVTEGHSSRGLARRIRRLAGLSPQREERGGYGLANHQIER